MIFNVFFFQVIPEPAADPGIRLRHHQIGVAPQYTDTVIKTKYRSSIMGFSAFSLGFVAATQKPNLGRLLNQNLF
jgi:hypothetical protein